MFKPTQNQRVLVSPFQFVALFLLVGVFLLSTNEAQADSASVTGVKQGYSQLSTSIETAKMPVFMSLYHRDFIYTAIDGAGMDRGPWRRVWQEEFLNRKILTAAFEIQKVLEDGAEKVVVQVREVIIGEDKESGERNLKETLKEETWVKGEKAWQLFGTVIKKDLTQAQLLPRATTENVKNSALQAVLASTEDQRQKVVDTFWKAVGKFGVPLIDASTDSTSQVTFVYKGKGSEARVVLEGGLQSGNKNLVRVDGTNIWFLTEEHRREARFSYRYRVQVNTPIPGRQKVALSESIQPDALNPNSSETSSIVALDKASPIHGTHKKDDVPSGAMDRLTLRSKILRERRFVYAYTPHGFDDSKKALPAVFLLDNVTYAARKQLQTVLDNGIATKRIPPMYVFLLHSEGSKSKSFDLEEKTIEMVGKELVEFAKSRFEVSSQAKDLVIGGNLLGANLALTSAIKFPGTFGKVICQSGDFNQSGPTGKDIIEVISLQEMVDIKVHLARGTLDSGVIRLSNRYLRDVLLAKGNTVVEKDFQGNFNQNSWLEFILAQLSAN